MRFKFFTIPIHGGDSMASELNRFLSGHRILSVERQFISDGVNSAWAVCVCFDSGGQAEPARTPAGRRGKIDFRDILSAPEFAVFARLRALRKETADAEGVPAYALFTNDQLAEMVRRRVTSAAALQEIPGVGEARVEKHGTAFLRILIDAALPEPLSEPHET